MAKRLEITKGEKMWWIMESLPNKELTRIKGDSEITRVNELGVLMRLNMISVRVHKWATKESGL